MIIDPLSAADNTLATASQAIQLVESVQKVSKFIHSMRGATDKIHSLIESIALLHQHLNHAKFLFHQQISLIVDPPSITPLTGALTSYEAKVKRLVAPINELQRLTLGPSQLYRKWGSLKVVCKRNEIESHEAQIREANAMLQSTFLINIALITTGHEFTTNSCSGFSSRPTLSKLNPHRLIRQSRK